MPEIHTAPLTPDRWYDFEAIMGPRGGAGGCWCMLWRLRKRDYEAMKGDANRDAIRAVVTAGPPPGMRAYAGEPPVGRLSIAPRAAFPRLERSEESRVGDAGVSRCRCWWSPDPNKKTN